MLSCQSIEFSCTRTFLSKVLSTEPSDSPHIFCWVSGGNAEVPAVTLLCLSSVSWVHVVIVEGLTLIRSPSQPRRENPLASARKAVASEEWVREGTSVLGSWPWGSPCGGHWPLPSCALLPGPWEGGTDGTPHVARGALIPLNVCILSIQEAVRRLLNADLVFSLTYQDVPMIVLDIFCMTFVFKQWFKGSLRNLSMTVDSSIHNQPKLEPAQGPSAGDRISKLVYIHMIAYFSATRRKELLIPKTWMTLRDVLLSERTQSRRFLL